MDSENFDTFANPSDESYADQILERQVQRLIEVQTYLRWILDVFLWLTVGTASIWALRSEIELWIASFTFEITYNRYDPKGDKKTPIQVYVIEVLNPHHVMTGVRMIKKCASGFTMVDEEISFTRGKPFIPFTNVLDIESFDNFTLDSSSSPPKPSGSSSGVEVETLHYRVYLGN